MSNKMSTTSPGRGQMALGAIYAFLALGAGGLSLGMNAVFGLKAGLGMMALFIMTDIAKMTLPAISAALGGWTVIRRAAYGVTIAISVMAAVSYLLETQAAQLIAAQATAEAKAGHKEDMERARRELSSIHETSTAASLSALAAAASAKAERESSRGGCARRCEAAKTEEAKLIERLGQAERRDQLTAKLAKTETRIVAAGNEALGPSDTLAQMTGWDKAAIAAAWSILMSTLGLIASELLATFTGDAAATIKQCLKARRKPRQAATQPTAIAEVEADDGRMTKAKALAILQGKIYHSPEMRLVASRRKLADELGLAKSTFRDWVAEWEGENQIKVETNGNRSVFLIPARKAA